MNAQTGEWGMYPKATVVNGTDGGDTYTSTSENEIFNLKKGNDTITFGAEFGDDEINANAKDWVINQEGSMNKDILKFTNHSVADGTLDFDITKDGDLVINSTGGSVTVNNFASPETPSAFIYDKNTDTTSENSIKLTSYEARGFYASKYKIDPQAHNNNAYDHANKSISTDTYPYALNTIFAMKGEDAEINENKGKINVYSEISSLENKHVFATLGGIDMDYWHQTDMADDTCITYDGDDNYEVFNITNDTKLRIKDTGGTDSITVRDDRLERLRLLFNVNADGTYDNVNMKIVRNDMITSDNFKSVYNSDTLGIRVTANADSESNGEGIEKILAAGHSVNNVTEWKDAIAGAVRTWLTNPANNFTDVEDALAHGSAAQITELYNLFNADYTATLASRVVSNIQTYQPFVYGSYTSYCTRAFGTDEAENIELINARGDDYRIYTGEGDDTVKLAGQRFNYFNQLYFGQTSSIFFKPGDDNDTITNSDTLANGVVVGDYTNEDQIDYAEKVFHGTTNSGNTSLYFKDVAPNNLTATRDGNDIILRYGENDSVRIENGYYSTNIGNITTYTADFNPLQEEQKTLGYYTYEDGVFTFHHSDYNEFTSVKQWNEYGNQLDDIPVYVETGSMKLSELFTNTIDNSEAAIAQTALGWIWNDNITASSHGDTIYGHNGNDTITGGAGNDIIYGGYGNDTINGGAGDDIIYGGEEHGIANSTWNTEQSDIIYGGEGNDRIYSAATYNDTSGLVWAKSEIYGGAGNDAISGAGHIDGGTGDDFIKLNRAMSYSTPDTVIGGAGNDTIVAHGSSGMLVNIDAGEGNDTLLTSTNYYDSDEGNEIERIDLRNNGYQPTLMGTVDMGAGRDHVAIASTAELTVDGGVDDDVIEVAAPQYISDFKTIVIKNSGGHDAVNLVSTRKTFNFNYHGEPLWDSDEQAYVVKKTFAPVAFFDMEINTSTGAITSTGTDIYICTTAPNRYVEESDLTYIGDKNNSIKFENGLVADHDFDIYIKNDESVGPFDYGSNYHYKGGYRILNIDYLKNAYAAKLKELGYSSMTAALSEVDADKLQANKEALAAIGMSEDAWVYTLDRPTEFSLGNFYDGDGSGQYYKDFGSGTGDENNLVTNFMRGMNHPLDEFFGGTDAKEFIYSTLNGDDIIRAGGGDDVIYGGRGNDQIYAGEGNNRIVFANHYYLYGSQVDHYNSPPYGQWYTINESTENGTTDGHDIVYSNGGTDTLDFMENDMVKFDKNGRDLVISYAFEAQEVDEELTDVATATVTVKDYFLANGDIDENHSAKYIKFKNRGVVALADEYNARNDAAYVWGTNEGEGLQGVYVYGGSGNDSLSAQGYGHDAYYLDGGEGSDTYSVDATSQNTQVIISDSGYTKGDIYLTNTHKTEFRAFYDVSATKDGDTVTTKLGDNLHIFDSSSGYSANGGIIVSLGYQNLLDENFDTSGYDLEVKVNNSKQYDGGYTIYSHELNGHYHTSSISSIVQQTQSWLADNYDACVAILGEGNVSTTNLMANTSADAAELKDSLLTQVNNNIYWS